MRLGRCKKGHSGRAEMRMSEKEGWCLRVGGFVRTWYRRCCCYCCCDCCCWPPVVGCAKWLEEVHVLISLVSRALSREMRTKLPLARVGPNPIVRGLQSVLNLVLCVLCLALDLCGSIFHLRLGLSNRIAALRQTLDVVCDQSTRSSQTSTA